MKPMIYIFDCVNLALEKTTLVFRGDPDLTDYRLSYTQS